jgi:hypothetical protein
MSEEGLLKKTMTTVAAMLGAWFVLIGLLTAITVTVIGKIVGSPNVDSAAAAAEKIPAPLPASGMRPIKSGISSKPSTEI